MSHPTLDRDVENTDTTSYTDPKTGVTVMTFVDVKPIEYEIWIDGKLVTKPKDV